MLLVLVWALGAHYLWTDRSASYDRTFFGTFRLEALRYVESNMLSLITTPDLESVQVGILFGSFHLFNGQPNLGFGVLGGTIKTAQLLGLHRGFWKSPTDGPNGNAHAYVWWALEIFEKSVRMLHSVDKTFAKCHIDTPPLLSDAHAGLTIPIAMYLKFSSPPVLSLT